MFGIVFEERIYFKTSEESRRAFIAEGAGPLYYKMKNAEGILTSYYELPDRLYDDPDELAEWARAAFAVALAIADGTEKATQNQSAKPSRRRNAAARARSGLFPFETRIALFEEGCQAFAKVVRCASRALRGLLALQLFLEAVLTAFPEQFAGHGQQLLVRRERRPANIRPRPSRSHHPRPYRSDPIPAPSRPANVRQAAPIPARPRQAEQARQKPSCAAIRHQPQPCESQRKKAERAAITRSPIRARLMPTPAAGPFMRRDDGQILCRADGAGRGDKSLQYLARHRRFPAAVRSGLRRNKSRGLRRSGPAREGAASSSIASIALRQPCIIRSDAALMVSGWFKVRTATPAAPSRSSDRNLCAVGPPAIISRPQHSGPWAIRYRPDPQTQAFYPLAEGPAGEMSVRPLAAVADRWGQ